MKPKATVIQLPANGAKLDLWKPLAGKLQHYIGYDITSGVANWFSGYAIKNLNRFGTHKSD